AAVAATILLAVAAFKVHLPNGFFNTNGGYEFALLWGLITLAIVFRGGDGLSVDRALGREF
ncbi:MAG: DoxX family protein, partial [Kiloniellales bacterium]|nr:DoxX family protein [Kiloniellales bacterium]